MAARGAILDRRREEGEGRARGKRRKGEVLEGSSGRARCKEAERAIAEARGEEER